MAVVQDPLAEYGSDLRLEMCRVSFPVGSYKNHLAGG